MTTIQTAPPASTRTSFDLTDPTTQAFWLLRIGFIVAPILFGLDKFAHVSSTGTSIWRPSSATC